jgi:PAS domain S-box-containing protein
MHHAEHALNMSEERFRQVVSAAPDGIVLADDDGKIVSWNTAAERLFGYTAGEILGHPLAAIMPTRFREDHQRGLEHAKATGVSPLTGRTIELHGLRKDGSEFPIEVSLGTWRFGGQMYSCGIVRDITLRKQTEAALQESEQQYRLLMEEASDGIVVLDRDGYIRMANSKACAMLGRTREELLQLHVRDTYVPSEKPIAQQRLEQLCSEQNLRYTRLLQRKDGTVISVEISATKMSDDRFLGIFRDLT